MKKINFFKKILLKIITKFQEITVKKGLSSYYFWTKLHYRIYFGKSLVEDSYNKTYSPEFQAAQHRHACMVLKAYYPGLEGFHALERQIQKNLIKHYKSVFIKNLLLDMLL